MIIQMIILITEIMFDPDPPVSLPAYEYVEWHNPGTDTVDLAGWKWVTGSGDKNVKTVKSGKIGPGDYLIICSPAAAPHFTEFGKVLAIESFPALRNSGDRLTILDSDGIPVHTVYYSPDAFGDVIRMEGGWSLELADLSKPCCESAWLSSMDPSGGTPGRENSVSVLLPDEGPPTLIRAAGYKPGSFLLLFTGALNPGSLVNNYSCILEPGGLKASSIQTSEYGFPGLFFGLPEALDSTVMYVIELIEDIPDCAGRPAICPKVRFGFPLTPNQGDLVISEIMFDPRPDQVEFVEVYNNGDHTVELAEIILARADTEGKIISFSDEQDISFLLFPGEFAVLSGNGRRVGSAWPASGPGKIAGRSDMPVLPNTGANLLLLTKTGDTIDQAGYSSDWHYPYITDSKGVSLERIDFSQSGAQRSNWFSASAEAGFATPGETNSNQRTVEPVAGRAFFSLISPVGSTGEWANPPAIDIGFAFDEAGWFAQVSVFNSHGKLIRILHPFGQLGLEGTLRWEGLDDRGRIAPEGIYLVVAEYRHPSGRKGRWKKACGISRSY